MKGLEEEELGCRRRERQRGGGRDKGEEGREGAGEEVVVPEKVSTAAC